MRRIIICTTLIILQIYCVVNILWAIAVGNMSGGWGLGYIPFVLIYFFLLFIGLILIIWLAIKNQWDCCIIIIISFCISAIFIFPGFGVEESSVRFLEPLAKSQLDKKHHDFLSGDLLKNQKDYNALKEYFNSPRKVIKAKDALIMLDDFKIIAIRGASYSTFNPEFDRYLNNNVVGHYVNVDIGSFEHFNGFYSPDLICDSINSLRKISTQKLYALPFYGCIPAEVYLDGVSLGDKLSLKWGRPVKME